MLHDSTTQLPKERQIRSCGRKFICCIFYFLPGIQEKIIKVIGLYQRQAFLLLTTCVYSRTEQRMGLRESLAPGWHSRWRSHDEARTVWRAQHFMLLLFFGFWGSFLQTHLDPESLKDSIARCI